MEEPVKRYEQMWLPGFEPVKVEQPDLPGLGNDDIEPSVSDVEEPR